MKLLTKKLKKKLPALEAQYDKGDRAIAYVEFFAPWNNLSWFATEFDGEDTFFGLVFGDFIEFGHFSLFELKAIKGPNGMKIERNKFFDPMPLLDVKQMIRKQGLWPQQEPYIQ